jgi:hypothetical protein
MRLPVVLPLAALALTLAACNKAPDTPKTAEQVKAEVAKMDRPEPGKYRSTMKIIDVSIPGMPADRMAQMKNMFGASGKTMEFCLTPQEANKGFEELNKRAAEGNCTYESFTAGGGTLDAKMTCQTGKGMTTTSELHGSYSPTKSDLTMKTDTSGAGMPGAGMHMEAQVINERIGDCT